MTRIDIELPHLKLPTMRGSLIRSSYADANYGQQFTRRPAPRRLVSTPTRPISSAIIYFTSGWALRTAAPCISPATATSIAAFAIWHASHARSAAADDMMRQQQRAARVREDYKAQRAGSVNRLPFSFRRRNKEADAVAPPRSSSFAALARRFDISRRTPMSSRFQAAVSLAAAQPAKAAAALRRLDIATARFFRRRGLSHSRRAAEDGHAWPLAVISSFTDAVITSASRPQSFTQAPCRIL